MLPAGHYTVRPRVRNPMSQTTRNTKNSTLAIPMAAPANPPKPRTAAIRASIRNINDQCSIYTLPVLQGTAIEDCKAPAIV
jgi:hypothetical protein